MTREELEHAIRAACDVAGDSEVYVFGSQAILGQVPDALAALRQSAEADIAPVHAPDAVDLIDAMLGQDSQFHATFGFYVRGVPIAAAVLPRAWQRRTVAVKNANTHGKTGHCVEAHDLAASKLVAFREKDRDFVRVLLREEIIDPRTLRMRILQLPLTPGLLEEPHRARLLEWLAGTVQELGGAAT